MSWADGLSPGSEGLMMRSVTVGYLVLATLVGPRLCPCSVSAAERPSPSPLIPLQAVPRACGCCPLPGLIARTVSPPSREQCLAVPGVPRKCQCGKQDTAATVRVVGRAVKSCADHDDLLGAVHTYDVACPVRLPHVLGFENGCNLPFWTTHDLLYVFHRLRC